MLAFRWKVVKEVLVPRGKKLIDGVDDLPAKAARKWAMSVSTEPCSSWRMTSG